MPFRFLKPALIAFFLLLAQQAGWTHAASHLAGERAPVEKQLPPSKACAECVAYAPLAAGLCAKPVTLALPAAAPVRVPAASPLVSPRRTPVFRSRAPPSLPG